ncbi:MAG: hypothetical protein ACI93P_000576 [bacterium]
MKGLKVRNRIVPVPSYIRDILVKGEPHHNIFSNKPQPLNQDYFKTLWSRFKRQSNTLDTTTNDLLKKDNNNNKPLLSRNI